MTVLTDPSGWFTLQLPHGWESATEDCVTTLRGPRRIGALFLSGGRHAGGRQASFGGADFLARFLRSLGLHVDEAVIEGVPGVGCRIYSYARETDAEHWRYWSITDDETALLLSYTCDPPAAGCEATEVESIIRSVRLYHSGSIH
jgi:hypothetical protein